MKRHLLIKRTIALVMLVMAATGFVAQSIPNRPERLATVTVSDNIDEISFYGNPLLLDNKPLNYDRFSIFSKGTLAVVSGNPETPGATKIPFRIYLLRNGQRIGNSTSVSRTPCVEVDIASVLVAAKIGDSLVIEPVEKCHWRARRQIRLNNYVFDPIYNLFAFLKNGKIGC